MRLPNFCNRFYTTSTLRDRLALESPLSQAFAEKSSFHAACPAETLAISMIEYSLV